MSSKQQYSTDLGLSLTPELQESKNPGVYGEMIRMRNALRILQGALDLYTGALSPDSTLWSVTSVTSYLRTENISRVYFQTTEAISVGQAVNIYSSAGVTYARLANATNNTKPCRAYATTNIASGDFGEFILLGAHPLITGVTGGTDYYLSTTGGALTATPPAAVGNIVQKVGWGLNSTTLYFNPSLTWVQL
jgi:hypothetical protein